MRLPPLNTTRPKSADEAYEKAAGDPEARAGITIDWVNRTATVDYGKVTKANAEGAVDKILNGFAAGILRPVGSAVRAGRPLTEEEKESLRYLPFGAALDAFYGTTDAVQTVLNGVRALAAVVINARGR